MCGKELSLQPGCEVFRRGDGGRKSRLFVTSCIEVETWLLFDVTAELESQRRVGEWNEIKRIGIVEEEVGDEM